MVPVFNEAAILEQAIVFLRASLSEVLPPPMRWKIVIIDNGSTDHTGAVCEKLVASDDHISTFSCARNGRGWALREAVRAFPGWQLYCYCDCDIPVDPSSILRLLKPLAHGTADIVLLKRSGARPILRRILSLGYRIFLVILFRLSFSDVQAGVKAFNERASRIMVTRCREQGYFLDTEFIIHAARNGYRITEVPVLWIEQRFSLRKSKIHCLKDSFAAIRALMRIRRRLV